LRPPARMPYALRRPAFAPRPNPGAPAGARPSAGLLEARASWSKGSRRLSRWRRCPPTSRKRSASERAKVPGRDSPLSARPGASREVLGELAVPYESPRQDSFELGCDDEGAASADGATKSEVERACRTVLVHGHEDWKAALDTEGESCGASEPVSPRPELRERPRGRGRSQRGADPPVPAMTATSGNSGRAAASATRTWGRFPSGVDDSG